MHGGEIAGFLRGSLLLLFAFCESGDYFRQASRRRFQCGDAPLLVRDVPLEGVKDVPQFLIDAAIRVNAQQRIERALALGGGKLKVRRQASLRHAEDVVEDAPQVVVVVQADVRAQELLDSLPLLSYAPLRIEAVNVVRGCNRFAVAGGAL